jgi:hypothetical protein
MTKDEQILSLVNGVVGMRSTTHELHQAIYDAGYAECVQDVSKVYNDAKGGYEGVGYALRDFLWNNLPEVK